MSMLSQRKGKRRENERTGDKRNWGGGGEGRARGRGGGVPS